MSENISNMAVIVIVDLIAFIMMMMMMREMMMLIITAIMASWQYTFMAIHHGNTPSSSS